MAKTKSENTDRSLRLVALGGLHELGKNMWVFENSTGPKEEDSEYIIVDAGIIYPGHDQPSVDYVMPEFHYAIKRSDKIKALVLTSANESHMGCATQVIEKCNIKKVVGSKLALARVKNKLEAAAKNIEWVEFESRKEIEISNFKITPYELSGSASDTYGVLIEAFANKVFYTGTYKIDQTPVDGSKFDMRGLSLMSTPDNDDEKRIIDLYLADSAFVEQEGYSASEMTVAPKLRNMLKEETGRVIFNTCNANTKRMQTVFNLAEEFGRKVALLNQDVKEAYAAAKDVGVISHKEETLATMRETEELEDDKILILSSAPEGDALKELILLATDEDLELQLKEGDVIINSASPPPGTIRVMAQISDKFFLKKVKIIGGGAAGIDVQPHAMTEEMKFMFNLVRPKAFAPVLGETRQLVRHAKLAVDTGFDPSSIFMIENGDVVQISQAEGLEITGKIQTGEIMFNHLQDFNIDDKVVKEREMLSKEGVVTIALTLNKKGKIVGGPVFSAKACTFSKNKEWRAFCMINTQPLVDSVDQLSVDKPGADITEYQKLVHEFMSNLIRTQIGKKPAVSVIINQI